jgi:tetratricopeptide (TPR) repeat protein
LRYASREDIQREPERLLIMGYIAERRGEDARDILTRTYKFLHEACPDYAPGFVAAGDLALSKGSYATSAAYYDRALAIDADSQEALAGLARCYWLSRDERLDATLQHLTELNPNHPEGTAVRVEMLLDAGQTEEAESLIAAMLEMNPNQLEFRALHAAALFLEDKGEEMERAQQQALAFNSHFSGVYRVPGRIASRHYRFREGSELQRRAIEVDPGDHEARAQLGLDLLRLGEDEAGRQELATAFQADPYNVQVFNSLRVLDTLEEYETLERNPFLLQMPPDEVPILADSAASLLQEAAAVLQEKYVMDLETPVRIQIFHNHDDFMVRSVGLPGSTGHLGICFGKLITMDSPSARPKGSMDWHSVLWHEFTHVITLQKTKNRMPRWLSEGISVYEETERNPGWGMQLDPGYGELIEDGAMPTTADLELYFTQPKTPQHLMLGYFLAGEFVKHYVERYGQVALVETLDRIAAHEDTHEALAVSAKVSIEHLDAGFAAFLDQRFAVLANLPSFSEALRRGVHAQGGQDWTEAEAAFQEARALFPDYVGEANPLALLAEVYAMDGRTDALCETLEAVLVLDTNNLDARRRLTSIYAESSNWPSVERIASGAVAIDPFDVKLCRQVLRAQKELGRDAEALKTAERLAILDAPRAMEYRLAQVELLMNLRQWDEAKQLTVHLLEETPRYWEAQRLLLTLVERPEHVVTPE